MQTIIVDMTPGFRMPTIYYSQGDVGTQFAIDLRSRFGDSFPTGTTVTIQATKPSGFGFSVAATSVTNGVATFTTTAEMTDEFGRFPAELKVTKTGLTLFSANFYMDGEENTHPDGTIDGQQETVIPELAQLVERVEDAASSVLDMTVEAETLAAGSDATYSYDEETNTATFGIPKGADGSLASGVLAPTYSSSSTYAVGDYVYYSGSLYRCTTAITTAEAWTSGHWTQVALAPEVSDLKSEINYILTPKSEVDADLRKDKWYIRANGTVGFDNTAKGAVINCKGNTCYRLVDTGNATYVGIGCANTVIALDTQLQKWKTDNSVLDIITPSDAIRLFYYTSGDFDDLTIFEMQVVDKSAQVAIAELEATTDALNSAVVPPTTFNFASSGNNTVMMDLDVNRTYIIENTLDSLSDVIPRAYMGDTKIEDIVSSLRRGSIIEYTPSAQADSIKFYCASNGAKVSVREKNTIYDVTYSVNTPLVQFKYSEGLKDVSAENSKMDWITNNAFDILPQVYALFDALVTNHPDYVTKVDAATEMSMSYPEYANGIETAGEYMVTPQYKTYMYKFIDTNANAGNGVGGNTEKKKIFIYGAEHGNEVASAFNCYLLANELCKCADEDIFALRAGYDIYILPCLDGYGMYHRIRGNGNLVNINRNFPVLEWTKSGEDTKTDEVDALNQYTGESAGSEFETQLIIALINSIKPNVIIDHHNYGSEKEWQFYVESVNAELVEPMYRSLVDCSIAFKKEYPMYFGNGYGLLIDDVGSLLEHVPSIGAIGGMSYRWARQNGYYASAIVEISKCINYLNGVPTNVEQEKFSDKTFSIGLYTLENTLKRICEYEAKKVK